MKRILVFVLLAVASTFAQQGDLTGFAGRVNASQYGSWAMPIFYGTPAGAGAIIVGGNGRVTLPDGVEFVPFKVGTPLLINDGPNTETVTPTAIGNCGNGKLQNTCTITATFTKAHGGGATCTVSSGTAGLQEAINALLSSAGLVVISGSWNGTSSMITTTATGSTAVGVEDLRVGIPSYYAWSGSHYTLSAGSGNPVVLNPAGNQTILNGFNLTVDAGGAIEAADSGSTTAVLDLLMLPSSQGQLAYFNPTTGNNTSLRFNSGGSITINPVAGADDGAHGVVINNAGLYIAGTFSDGNSLTLAQGGMQIAGGGIASGNPVFTMGSSGVEGVFRFFPQLNGGSYTIRAPNTALTNVINWPNGSGSLPLIATTLAPSSSVCTDINSLLITTSCGSTLFSAIGAGTNNSSAMIVGTGASLTISGSGTINATSLLGLTWASPGIIGSTTPAKGFFTYLATSQGPWIDPMAYGCVGDGTTDDTACFQAAVNFMEANGGAIHLGSGKSYKLDRVQLAGFDTIRGVSGISGELASRIFVKTDAAFVSKTPTSYINAVTITDVEFRAAGVNAIDIPFITELDFEHIHFFSGTGCNIALVDGERWTIRQVEGIFNTTNGVATLCTGSTSDSLFSGSLTPNNGYGPQRGEISQLTSSGNIAAGFSSQWLWKGGNGTTAGIVHETNVSNLTCFFSCSVGVIETGEVTDSHFTIVDLDHVGTAGSPQPVGFLISVNLGRSSITSYNPGFNANFQTIQAKIGQMLWSTIKNCQFSTTVNNTTTFGLYLISSANTGTIQDTIGGLFFGGGTVVMPTILTSFMSPNNGGISVVSTVTTWSQALFGDKITSGRVGFFNGDYDLLGSTSGVISFKPQAAAGTYNFNMPITAGTAGQALTSQAGGATAMTWTTPDSIRLCGTTTTCANTVQTAPIIVYGDVTFPTATTVSLSALPFTSSTSYSCTASDLTTAAGVVNFTTYTSGSAATLTETGGTNVDHARYVCVGN